MKLYSIYVVLGSPDRDRLAQFVGDIRDLMTRFGKNELAFRSAAADVFGYFLQTTKNAAQIRAAIDHLDSTRNGDIVMVVELGKEFDAIGGSRAWTFLQSHQRA